VVSAGICGEDEVRGNSERIYKEMIGGLLAVIFAAAPDVLAQDRNSSGPRSLDLRSNRERRWSPNNGSSAIASSCL